ncbi:MAG: hypothetical protein D6722_29010, partial [Bacteroidetes bacterium]
AVQCLLPEAGGLWMGTDAGLARLQQGQLQLVADGPPGSVLALLRDPKNQTWAGTNQGLYLRQGNGPWRPFQPLQGQMSDQAEINALAQDQAGFIWAGTFGQGLWRIGAEGSAFRRYTQTEGPGLTNDYIFCLLVDQADLLWAGTYGDGIYLLDLVQVHFGHLRRDPDNEEGLIDNNVYAITEDPAGHLWVGTEAGLSRVARTTHRAINLDTRDGLPDPVVNALCMAPDSTLWVGTAMGLARWKRQPQDTRPVFEALPSITDQVLCLLEAPSGGLWVGRDAGLSLIDAEGELLLAMTAEKGAAIQALLYDRKGQLWGGTDRGLVQEQAGSLLPVPLPEGQPTNVLALYEDTRGYLWVGTEGRGLLCLNPERSAWQTFSTEEGLPDDDVY